MISTGRDLHVTVRGKGERVLFVHGSFGDGLADWMTQRPLAESFLLCMLDRRGYGESPSRLVLATWDAGAFAAQAEEIGTFMEDGAHLVGHSYGGVLSLLAAARRPEAVRSVTVIEPPAYAIARGHPDVEALIAHLAPLYTAVPEITPEDFRARAFAAMGFVEPPHALTDRERKNATATMAEPPGWLADLPLDRLARAPFPKLVVSGNWGGDSPSARDVAGRACAAVCAELVERVRAEHAIVEGAGHAVQYTGARFNQRLAAFLSSAGG